MASPSLRVPAGRARRVDPEHARLDVQPFLERGGSNIWARVDQAHDRICELFEQVSKDLGYDALVVKSDSFVKPAWVKLVCWTPKDSRAVTDRRGVIVTVEAKEFHRYDIEYTVELQDRGWEKTYKGVFQFDEQLATDLVRFCLAQGPRPGFEMIQTRQAAYELWKPRNKVDAVSIDWLRVGLVAAIVLGVLTLAVGIGLLFFAAAGLIFYLIKQRRCVVRCSGKPEDEPRTLVRVDSWQAVVSGLGDGADELRRRFLQVARHSPLSDARVTVERNWNWGLDGVVEREQIAIVFRRTIAFCHIYQYDRELYVGWEAHLNAGQWVEKTVVTGIEKATGVPTQVNTVVPGYQRLTEYDITDADCLLEWTHAKLVELVRGLMEERKIEQEIDFTILRGQRQGLTEQRKEGVGDAAQNAARQLKRKLLRTA